MTEQPDRDSRTQEATEKRLRDALNEGNAPVSRELVHLFSLVALLVFVLFFVADNFASSVRMLHNVFEAAGTMSLNQGGDVINLLGEIARTTALAILPLAMGGAVLGILATAAQTPVRLIAKRIVPQMSRLSPQKGLERIFGAKGVVEFLKAILKFSILALVAAGIAAAQGLPIASLVSQEPQHQVSAIRTSALWIIAGTGLVFAALAVADVGWTRWTWRRDLRMAPQEIKDEHKQAEGDPRVRARLRETARAIGRKRMMAAVPQATLVIVNPTHYAVALRYVGSEMAAPVVVAKGLDLVALRIRDIAEQEGIAVFEEKSLARSLYAAVDVGKMIPPEFYKAVAVLIRSLMRQHPKPLPAKW